MRFPAAPWQQDHIGGPSAPTALYQHARAPVAPHAAAAARRKGTGIRAWVVLVPGSGSSHLEEMGKHTIMRRTGLPARDLRVLDPALSYPSTILGRERAIVVNLEHVRAIITAAEVLIPKSNQPLMEAFIQDLQCRASAPSYNASPQQVSMNRDMDGEGAPEGALCSPPLHASTAPPEAGANTSRRHHDRSSASASAENVLGDSPNTWLEASKGGGSEASPFEFRALEVCLESVCRCLESETLALEQEAYPALDELTTKISTLTLERVRLIKNRLVTISGRVQKASIERVVFLFQFLAMEFVKVRDELEHLLDDDTDMAVMYLTKKLASQSVGGSFRVDLENDDPDLDDERDEATRNETESHSKKLSGFKPDTEELEKLLEAYFVQIDATLNKLSALRDYVDDTEDYINIMLDEKQNRLLEMGVMLSTATLVSSAGIVVVGLLGMNIHISLFDSTSSSKFWETAFSTVGGCAILYFLSIAWGKKRGLLH